jgi:membrane-associated phospholipid phosphatase
MLVIKALRRRVRPYLWLPPLPETDSRFPSGHGHSVTSVSSCPALALLAWPARFRWPSLVLGASGMLLRDFSSVYLDMRSSEAIGAWAAGTLWPPVT